MSDISYYIAVTKAISFAYDKGVEGCTSDELQKFVTESGVTTKFGISGFFSQAHIVIIGDKYYHEVFVPRSSS